MPFQKHFKTMITYISCQQRHSHNSPQTVTALLDLSECILIAFFKDIYSPKYIPSPPYSFQPSLAHLFLKP